LVLLSNKEHFKYLKGATKEYLEENIVGIDRDVAIPVHAGFKEFDFSYNQKNSSAKSERYLTRLQRKLAKQKKGSKRRDKTKYRIANHHAKKANIRLDFCHKTSRTLVKSQFKVFVFEDLKISNMTRKPKPKQDEQGKYLPNQAKAKAGLNKSILNAGWHYLESFTKYKANQADKAFFKVSAAYTSQECAKCDHTHPDSRKSQDKFVCDKCGHVDNADNNASTVISKSAIELILDTGTVLSERGVLRSDIGRGGKGKTGNQKRQPAHANETAKKMGLAA
jgi:putative transposase